MVSVPHVLNYDSIGFNFAYMVQLSKLHSEFIYNMTKNQDAKSVSKIMRGNMKTYVYGQNSYLALVEYKAA